MPEIPNVVGGEIITDEWGNLIRSRTVQRYATVAARTAAHPSPVEGDLSYLQDSNTVDVWNGTAWALVGPIPPFANFRIVGGGAGQNVGSGGNVTLTFTGGSEIADTAGAVSGGVFTCPAAWAGRWHMQWAVITGGADVPGLVSGWLETPWGRIGSQDHNNPGLEVIRMSGSGETVFTTGQTCAVTMFQNVKNPLTCNDSSIAYFQGSYRGPT